MPGSGKTTLGKQLAQETHRPFLDTDHLIEHTHKRPLQVIMDQNGPEKFLNLETQTLLGLNPHNTIISTGGSAIYSPQGMAHLQEISTIIFLDVPLTTLKQRLHNLQTRGLYKTQNQTLDEIFKERHPLYQQHAHHTLQGSDIQLKDLLSLIQYRPKDQSQQ